MGKIVFLIPALFLAKYFIHSLIQKKRKPVFFLYSKIYRKAPYISGTEFLNFTLVRLWSDIQEINSVIENFWKEINFDSELNWFKRTERAILPRAQGFFSLRLVFHRSGNSNFCAFTLIAFLLYCEECCIVQEMILVFHK